MATSTTNTTSCKQQLKQSSSELLLDDSSSISTPPEATQAVNHLRSIGVNFVALEDDTASAHRRLVAAFVGRATNAHSPRIGAIHSSRRPE